MKRGEMEARWRKLLRAARVPSAVLVVCGGWVEAFPIRVTLDWPAGAPAHVQLQAVRVNAAEAIVRADTARAVTILDLSEGVWQLHVSAPGYWSDAAQVSVSSPADVKMSVWPAASLRGQIRANGEPLPEFIEVQLSNPKGPDARQPLPSPQHVELHCPVVNGSWSCTGPSGIFDVRLQALEYVARYKWNVDLRALQETDLGPIVLTRSASIFGRAVRRDGSDPLGPCRANIGPDDQRRRGPETETLPTGTTRASVSLSSQGYFQLADLAPGVYAISVECPDASAFADVSVEANTETRIDTPLLLDELSLDFALSPKLDPERRPWQITVDENTPRLRRVADKASASGGGRWMRRGLAAGNYHVSVTSADGALWLDRYVDLGSDTRSIALNLAFVRVVGTVMMGRQPVRAELAFFNDAGGATASLVSNNEGVFEGFLPVAAPGDRETSWTVEAHVANPRVTRRLLGVAVQPSSARAGTRLDLMLRTVAVRGTVVSTDGQPATVAQVTFEDSTGARTTTGTDANGVFELPDLPPGKYTAMADSPDGESDRQPFEVVDGSESVLKLVLNPARRVRLNVVSDQGPVANAAVQVWAAPGVPLAFTRTDQNGRFYVNLPPGTAELGLTIGAPGYALKLVRVPVPNGSDDSPDTPAITLNLSGATLALNLEQSPPQDPGNAAATAYLVHNGAIETAAVLASWGSDRASGDGVGPEVIEAVEPGAYALCLLTDPAEMIAVWKGSLPSDRCQSGSVNAGGVLTLSPKSR